MADTPSVGLSESQVKDKLFSALADDDMLCADLQVQASYRAQLWEKFERWIAHQTRPIDPKTNQDRYYEIDVERFVETRRDEKGS